MIVGGGTSGCVLAARICENLPDSTVTILERGTPRTARQDLLVQAPRLFSEAWNVPQLTEEFQTEPNPALDGRTLRQLTGNTLGGSSAVNGAQWTKPPLATFDKDIWAFNGVLPIQTRPLLPPPLTAVGLIGVSHQYA